MMRSITAAAILLTSTLLLTEPSAASNVGGSINETANIVPGNTVSVYLAGDNTAVTVVDTNDGAHPTLFLAYPLLARINFESQASQYFVKYVLWDKPHRTLDINF